MPRNRKTPLEKRWTPAPQCPTAWSRRCRDALSFRYAYDAATRAPSKQTATNRKGRAKDEEAAEDTQEPKFPTRDFRRPSFLTESRGGKAYGSAIHAVLQYLRYENCGSEDDVKAEIARLVFSKFITEEQGKLADSGKIAAFSIRNSAGSSAPDAPACGNSSSPSSTTAAITATVWTNRCSAGRCGLRAAGKGRHCCAGLQNRSCNGKHGSRGGGDATAYRCRPTPKH